MPWMSGRREQAILRKNGKTSSSRSECNSFGEMKAVYAGWLTKSPEDRKGLLSLFAARQQWRRRYFVLYSSPPSTEDSHSTNSSSALVYYENEAMEVKKGTIDLGNCEEVIDHVESCYYRHLFLLKTTTPRGHRRTYYLAADCADEITNWVRKLHSTLNLYEDQLFTKAVLSVTSSGSSITGIIARVTKIVDSSDSSNTNTKKTSVSAALMLGNPKPTAQMQVCSETTTRGLDLLSNNSVLHDTYSGTSVSQFGTKLTNSEIPVDPTTSAETGSPTAVNSVSPITRSVGSKPSPATSCQPRDLQNEASSSSAFTEQNGDEYYEDWQQLVKDLLVDGPSSSDCTVEGNEHRGTEEDGEGREGKVEGKSIFYVYTSSFSPDTKATGNSAHKGGRPDSSESKDEAPALPSAPPSSDVTRYLRITRGSHRYRSVKKKTQNIDAVF